MSDLRTAAQQALNSLRGYRREIGCKQPCDAERALEAALEQPEQEVKGCDHCNHPLYAAIKCHACGRVTEQEQEQEPLAWCDIEEDGYIHGLRYWSEPGRREHALYTHPPRREWRGLTEWEINDGLDQLPTEDVCSWSFRKGVYFAEAALKERNA